MCITYIRVCMSYVCRLYVYTRNIDVFKRTLILMYMCIYIVYIQVLSYKGSTKLYLYTQDSLATLVDN